MVRPEGGDSIEIAPDGVRVPVVPAKPPVLGWSVVHAEAVTIEVEPRIGNTGEREP